jgi:hypothetical protein
MRKCFFDAVKGYEPRVLERRVLLALSPIMVMVDMCSVDRHEFEGFAAATRALGALTRQYEQATTADAL